MSKKHPIQVNKWLPYSMLLFAIVIVLSGGIMLTFTAIQNRTQNLTLGSPEQRLTLQWVTPSADEYFLDSVFSRDGNTVYALTNRKLLAIKGWEIRIIHEFFDDMIPHTLVIHPTGTELAIGAVERTGEQVYYHQGMILIFDLELFEISEQFTSGASYNLGASKVIQYTPDGEALYHLYNLNNAGCGRTFDILERWDIATDTYEGIELPTSHAFELAVMDDAIAVMLSSSCLPMMNSTSLVIISDDGNEHVFSTEGTTGYQHLQSSHDQQVMIGSLNTVQPPFQSTVHIWNNFEMIEEIDFDQVIQSMALSPDNAHIALTIARDAVPVAIGNDRVDIELHIYDRQLNRVTMAMQLNTDTPIEQIIFSPDGSQLILRNADQIAVIEL